MRRFAVTPLVCVLAVLLLGGCTGPPTAPPAAPAALGDRPSGPDAEPGSVGRSPLPAVAQAPSGRVRGQMWATMVPDHPAVMAMSYDGWFDRDDDAIEVVVDMGAILDGLPPGLVGDLPPEMYDDMTVLVLGDTAYVKMASAPMWDTLRLGSGEVSEVAGVALPGALLDQVVAHALDVTEADGGQGTTVYSGWLAASLFDDVAAVSTFDAIAGAGSRDLMERLVRFDLVVDEDGWARRLVVELDSEAARRLGEQVDGPGQGQEASEVILSWSVEWSDLGSAVTIDEPAATDVMSP